MGAYAPHSAVGRAMMPWKVRESVDRGLLAWLLAMGVLLAIRIGPESLAPALTRDSFQYLSVANQMAHRQVAQTPLVHYDAERSFGVVPAPMVTFPLGYPAAIAPLAWLGVPLPMAALLVNIASALLCVALLWWCTGALGIARPHRHVSMAIMVVNAFFLAFTGMGMSELLFTAVSLGAITLTLASRNATGRTAGWWWIAAGIAFGMAYHVRYAGLFLMVGLVALLARHLAIGQWRTAAGYGLAATIAGGLASLGIARNMHLVGHWLGRDSDPVRHPVSNVLLQSVRAADLLVLGPGSGDAAKLLAPRVLFVALIVFAGAFAVRRLFQGAGRRRIVSQRETGFGADLPILLAVYGACMFYAAITTNISYGPRMFVPMVPVIALLAGIALTHILDGATPASARVVRGAFATAFLVYLVMNLSAVRYPQADRAHLVQTDLSARTSDGRSVRDVVRHLVGPDGVVVANNGQAVGYVLDRATISLPGPRYSKVRWNERALRRLVDRYHAKVVLITAPDSAQPADDDLIPTVFVQRLAQGMSPAWLQLESRAGNMLVYVPIVSDSTASNGS
jgi:MFS family permease